MINLKRLIPDNFITFLKNKLGVPSQQSSFVRLKNLGFNPKNIIDIGAYEGNWTTDIKTLFPDAHVLMIEGQENKKSILLEKINSISNTTLTIALLGAERKSVKFNIYESASSVFTEDNETDATEEFITLSLLDDVVKGTSFEQVDLIKIDTQGYELEILKGGQNVLSSAQCVLLEVSLLGIYKEAPLVAEVIAYMKQNGFVLYDICSLMRRPYDKALFQSDFMFLKEDHHLRSSTRWR